MMKRRDLSRALAFIAIVVLAMLFGPVKGSAEENTELPSTGFENREGGDWTSYDEEQAFLEEVSRLSERVSYSSIGTTAQGRTLNLVKVGFPEAPSDEDIAAGHSMLVIGTQHGNEGAPREMALQLLRDLAFTEDPELLDQLSETTILFIPTANPDGREANTRSNSDGIDINREHLSLLTLEVQAISSVLRQFQPDITVDAHERPRASGNPDIEMLWPRNLNVDGQLRGLSQEMVEGYLFPQVESHGFSTGIYGTPGGAGDGNERILRNMIGLRNGIGLLTETAGLQEPSYRVEAQMRAVESTLAFYRERFADITEAVSGAPERQQLAGANQSVPFYLDGADNWNPTRVLQKKPSGYLLNSSQASEMDRHISLFGLQTEEIDGEGIYLSMEQSLMAILPFLLDKRATNNEVSGIALYDINGIGTAGNLKALVEHFEEEGDFAAESDARLLKNHLIALDRYENQNSAEKVLKHLDSFRLLLDHQHEDGLLSDSAFEDIAAYTEYLQHKWNAE